MINIFLDDERYPVYVKDKLGKFYPQDWVIARDYFQFVKIVDENWGDIGIISFDNDLKCFKDGVEFTGTDCMQYLLKKCIDTGDKLPNWYIHTSNTWGRKHMIADALLYLKHFEGIRPDWRYYNAGIIDGNLVNQ